MDFFSNLKVWLTYQQVQLQEEVRKAIQQN